MGGRNGRVQRRQVQEALLASNTSSCAQMVQVGAFLLRAGGLQAHREPSTSLGSRVQFYENVLFPLLRGWLQNILKFVFYPSELPECCAHLSYIIFLSICGFEVMA